MSEYYTTEKATKILGVSRQTLLTWERAGKIKCCRTQGGHRRYALDEINRVWSDGRVEPVITQPILSDTRRRICYCRVSTSSQKEDLKRQVQYFGSMYPEHEIVSDIGSGINFKRKGLLSILDSAIKGDIEEIVVTHRDRLCRFGFELIERVIVTGSQGKIVVLNQRKTSPQQELVDDLVSIITVFSSRLYGLRSHQIAKQIKQITKEESTGETQDSEDQDISK